MYPAVFLDRDDTLIENRRVALPYPGDLCDPDLVRLCPGAAEACLMLKQSGFALIVVSNQGLVARGHGTIADVEATNHRMVELLRARIGSISREIDPDHILDAVYFCPFHPRGTVEHYAREHPWRKPSPGMILHAAEAHGIDVSRSWVVGDSDRDVQAGLAAGLPAAHCLRVGSGAAFADLLAAARHIVVQT